MEAEWKEREHHLRKDNSMDLKGRDWGMDSEKQQIRREGMLTIDRKMNLPICSQPVGL